MANEKRLIDANALIATLEKIVDEDETPFFHLDEIVDEIMDATTVDDEAHGYWIERPLDNFRKYEVKCSWCGFKGIGNYDQYLEPCEFNYCPNCGAKMDGGNEDG